jgi:hypothetical protein
MKKFKIETHFHKRRWKNSTYTQFVIKVRFFITYSVIYYYRSRKSLINWKSMKFIYYLTKSFSKSFFTNRNPCLIRYLVYIFFKAKFSVFSDIVLILL